MKPIHETRFEIDEQIYQQEDNIFVFDKPYKCTSFDLVAKVKYAMKHKFGKKLKVGHAGTLDPLATGVMIVCTGKCTKQIDSLQTQEKEYTGTFVLGATTPSFDMEKEVDAQFPIAHITEEMVRKTAQQFVGVQEQIPPQFSAVRIAGKRAFAYARQGQEVEILPRTITISEFEITRCELPEVDFRIVCSKGTYIRSIARDFGFSLDSGAYLSRLRRTRVGSFCVENAILPKVIIEEAATTSTQPLVALGLMSGTSLDGLDMALCEFLHCNDTWNYRVLKCETVHYDDTMRERLRRADTLSGYELICLHRDFGRLMGEKVNVFLQDISVKPLIIAAHGHTVYHRPDEGITLQIGNGAELAACTGITTICDFRTMDVALGGQGAPLVPLGDECLYGSFDACLNLGGFCNISFGKDGHRMAFDISPCNMLLNRLSERCHVSFDEGGKMAATGQILPKLLNQLNQLPYYHLKGNKSLGKEWFDDNMWPLFEDEKIDTADYLRTSCEHIAIQISNILNDNHIRTLLLTGGGAKNAYLIERIHSLAPCVKLSLPDEATIDFKESIIFAFLGILRWQHQNNCLCSATGAVKDCCGGAIYEGIIE